MVTDKGQDVEARIVVGLEDEGRTEGCRQATGLGQLDKM